MSIYDFIRLREKERVEVAFSGTLLDVVAYEGKDYTLYSVDNFFVEVIYESKGNKLSRIRPFTTTKQLEKYCQNYRLPVIA